MHIPDGPLSPQVCFATGAASIAAVSYSLYRLRDKLADRIIPLTGMTAALVFAGQMVNFPLFFTGAPVSGHLLGGVLAAALLGPWAGCLAIALVLLMQCLLFADGGILALGPNVLNMAVVGAWGGYAVLDGFRRVLGGGVRGTLAGVVAASWLTVMAGAAMFCLEFWWTIRFDPTPDAQAIRMSNVFTLMVAFHSLIGIGEAVITGGVIGFVLVHRPDLVGVNRAEEREHASATMAGLGRFLATGFVAAAAVAAFLAPFASEHSDGLEAVQEREFADRAAAAPFALVLSDYEIPSPFAGWSESPLWQKVSVSLAGLIGVAAVGLTAWLFDRGLRRRMKPEAAA